MTIWTIISILGITVGIVVAAVIIDVARDYVSEKKAERAARKEEKANFDEWALRMLTIAGLHRNVYVIHPRTHHGAHRRVRV